MGLFVFILSCNKEITAIGFDPNEIPLLNRKGQTFTIKAFAISKKGIYDGPLPQPVWMSSDESIVTVREGLITAISSGNAKIMVADGKVQKEIPVVVSILQKVTINQTSEIMMKKGEILQLSATAWDDKGKPIHEGTFLWSTSDKDIAKIDNTGKVEAIEFGQTQIKVVFVDKMAMITVKIEGQAPSQTSVPENTTEQNAQNVGQE